MLSNLDSYILMNEDNKKRLCSSCMQSRKFDQCDKDSCIAFNYGYSEINIKRRKLNIKNRRCFISFHLNKATSKKSLLSLIRTIIQTEESDCFDYIFIFEKGESTYLLMLDEEEICLSEFIDEIEEEFFNESVFNIENMELVLHFIEEHFQSLVCWDELSSQASQFIKKDEINLRITDKEPSNKDHSYTKMILLNQPINNESLSDNLLYIPDNNQIRRRIIKNLFLCMGFKLKEVSYSNELNLLTSWKNMPIHKLGQTLQSPFIFFSKTYLHTTESDYIEISFEDNSYHYTKIIQLQSSFIQKLSLKPFNYLISMLWLVIKNDKEQINNSELAFDLYNKSLYYFNRKASLLENDKLERRIFKLKTYISLIIDCFFYDEDFPITSLISDSYLIKLKTVIYPRVFVYNSQEKSIKRMYKLSRQSLIDKEVVYIAKGSKEYLFFLLHNIQKENIELFINETKMILKTWINDLTYKTVLIQSRNDLDSLNRFMIHDQLKYQSFDF